MVESASAAKLYCFDTMCLAHFARAERLDVLRELLLDRECWTTTVVRAELLQGAELRGGIAITDDRDATVVARRHGAEVHGTIWLLAQGCRDEKLTAIGAGSIVDALRTTGARLPCTGREFPVYAAAHGLLGAGDLG